MERGVRVTLASVLVCALFILNWQYGGLRFASARLNVLALAAAFLLPAVSMAWLVATPRSRGRVWAGIALTPIALASLLSSACVLYLGADVIKTSGDYNQVLLRSVAVDGPPVRVYLMNGNIVHSGDILIQQERPLPPGMIWVTRLYDEDPADSVTITVLDGHQIHCAFPPCEQRTQTHEVTIRTF
jgi:hypothetical protein